MGLEYQIRCSTCDVGTKPIEFSVVGYVSMKAPDEALETVHLWAEFLASHAGHTLDFVDGRGNRTHPAKVTGPYVLGLENRSSSSAQVKP